MEKEARIGGISYSKSKVDYGNDAKNFPRSGYLSLVKKQSYPREKEYQLGYIRVVDVINYSSTALNEFRNSR
jgi:hypothetical protein